MVDKYDVANFSIDELLLYAGDVASGDYLVLWDASEAKFVKVAATRVTFA